MGIKVTIYPKCTIPSDPHIIGVKTVYDRIKTGNNKQLIEKIRNEKDIDIRDELKKSLPAISFSGEFSYRNNESLIKHSGLICIDFDHIENVLDLKTRMCQDEYTYMTFISPSGDGLKVIVKIPPNKNTHIESYYALSEYYAISKIDDVARDLSRLCFESYDPDIYFSEDSKLFELLVKQNASKKKNESIYLKERIDNPNEIVDRLEVWLDKNFGIYAEGNRHNYLIRLCGACMRFGIQINTCSQILMYRYQNKSNVLPDKDFENIINTVYKNYSITACTAYFEKETDKPFYSTGKEVTDEVFKIELKDIIYLDNVKDSMLVGFKTGKARGTTTYFNSFDKFWTWRKREINFLGGIGNMGKTIMLINLCVIKAINEDWKFAFFSPEQDPPDDFYNDIIHTFIGKSTEPYHINQMSMEEYEKAMAFVKNHFFYIFPENENPTPDYINLCFKEVIKKHRVDCCVIDPFNQLDNDWKKNGRDDQYISEFLTKEKRFVQKHDIVKFIVGHPKSSLTKEGKDYSCPDVYDYAGGAMWNNKTDNILVYHRPFARSDPDNPLCIWASQKIKKKKLTGITGECEMFFDLSTNRFKEKNGFCPFENKNLDVDYEPNKFFETEYNETEEAPF